MRVNSKGFTLIELLLVILIITGLAAIVVPNYMMVSDDSDRAVRVANNESIKAAVRLLVLDAGLAAVAAVADLNVINAGPDLADSGTPTYIHGPYLETVPISSPAGTAYSVTVNAATGKINITPVP